MPKEYACLGTEGIETLHPALQELITLLQETEKQQAPTGRSLGKGRAEQPVSQSQPGCRKPQPGKELGFPVAPPGTLQAAAAELQHQVPAELSPVDTCPSAWGAAVPGSKDCPVRPHAGHKPAQHWHIPGRDVMLSVMGPEATELGSWGTFLPCPTTTASTLLALTALRGGSSPGQGSSQLE